MSGGRFGAGGGFGARGTGAGPFGRGAGGRSGESGQGADVGEGVLEGGRPGPSCGEAQDGAPGAVHDSPGQGEELVADGAPDGEFLVAAASGEPVDPTEQVVGERGAGQPGGVGGEAPRGEVLEPVLFEVPDGEFDGRVGAVVGVGVRGVEVAPVSDEGVVAPVRPEFALGGARRGAGGVRRRGARRPGWSRRPAPRRRRCSRWAPSPPRESSRWRL